MFKKLTAVGAACAITAGLGVAAASTADAAPAAAGTCAGLSAPGNLNPASYANRAVIAFGEVNLAALHCFTTPAAYNTMVSAGFTARQHWQLWSSQGAAGTVYETYRNSVTGEKMTLGVNDVSRAAGGWHAVYTASVSKPVSNTCDGMAPVGNLGSLSYANRTVLAFGAVNLSALKCYTTTAAYNTIVAKGFSDRKHWAMVGSQGAAGTIYVTYRNTVTGKELTLGVNDVSRGAGGWHAVYTAR